MICTCHPWRQWQALFAAGLAIRWQGAHRGKDTLSIFSVSDSPTELHPQILVICTCRPWRQWQALFAAGLAIRWQGAHRGKDTLSIFSVIRFAH
jgi:hypothetical protein